MPFPSLHKVAILLSLYLYIRFVLLYVTSGKIHHVEYTETETQTSDFSSSETTYIKSSNANNFIQDLGKTCHMLFT